MTTHSDSALRRRLIRLAYTNPQMRAEFLPLLAASRVAMEFDTQEELDKYKKEHDVRPGTKLTVKKQEDKAPKQEDKAPKQEDKAPKKRTKAEISEQVRKSRKHLEKLDSMASNDIISIVEGPGDWMSLSPRAKQNRYDKAIDREDREAVSELMDKIDGEFVRFQEDHQDKDLIPDWYPKGGPRTYSDLIKVYKAVSRGVRQLQEVVSDFETEANKALEEEEKAKKAPKYKPAVKKVMDAHNLTDDDAAQVKEFKSDKPSSGKKVSPAEMMQRFLSKAKPETKERMKGVTPAEFMQMLGAIMDDEEGGQGKTATELRSRLIRLAAAKPELRADLLPLLKL